MRPALTTRCLYYNRIFQWKLNEIRTFGTEASEMFLGFRFWRKSLVWAVKFSQFLFLKFVSSSHTILLQDGSQLARMHFSVPILSVSFSLLAKRMDLLKSDAKSTLRNKIIYTIVILPLLLLNILRMEIMFLKLHFRFPFSLITSL